MQFHRFDLAPFLMLMAASTLLGACDLFDDDDLEIPPGVGQVCAGIAGIACPGDLFCDLAPGQCNTADAAGTCVMVGEACTTEFTPVCGCDGVTYGNDCERRRARVAKDRDGPCEAA